MRAASLGILFGLLASGCATLAGGEERAGEGNAEPPFAFELGSCVIQEIVFSVAPEDLAAYLPDGFVAEPFPAEGLSALIALGIRCAQPEETTLGMVIIPLASTPEGLGRENASAQGIITSIVVDEGSTTRANLLSWGYGPALSNGTVRLADVTSLPDPAPRVGKTSVETEEGGRFVLDTLVRGTPRTDEGNFLRFFMVHERQVIGTWDCDLTGNHRIHSAEAHMEAARYAPLPDGVSAGLGFHEMMDSFRWTRVLEPAAR